MLSAVSDCWCTMKTIVYDFCHYIYPQTPTVILYTVYNWTLSCIPPIKHQKIFAYVNYSKTVRLDSSFRAYSWIFPVTSILCSHQLKGLLMGPACSLIWKKKSLMLNLKLAAASCHSQAQDHPLTAKSTMCGTD